MSKENPDTPKKGDNSPFQKFERLAKKIVRVPRQKAREPKPTDSYQTVPDQQSDQK